MFFKEIWQNRQKIFLMSLVDFKSGFKASVLSWFWVVINPILSIAVYIFAFAAGGNDSSSDMKVIYWQTNDFVFLQSQGKPVETTLNNNAWLIVGVLAWSYISSMMSGGATSVRGYNWMVTKVGTPLSVPPAIVCISKSIIGIPFIIVAWFIYMIINATAGPGPVITWKIIQLPFMIILAFVFMLLWSLFTAPLVSISKDMNNLIGILPFFLQWMSGTFIALDPSKFNSIFGWVFRINPLNFLLDNIRGSITGTTFFWNDGVALISFITCFSILTVLAIFSNRRKVKKIVADLV